MEQHKLIIIGSGPAGYTAAIYAARARLQPQLIAGEASGGQLMLTTEVENYPGFRDGILGPELMMIMREQAKKFEAEILDKTVSEVDFSKQPFMVRVGNEQYLAKAVILATGAESIPLKAPGEREYSGRGVSYCAVCDAAFYKDKRVFVVGGGDAAMEDTLALTKFAKKITILHRRDSFRASKIMQERVLSQTDKVDVWWDTEVVEVKGNGQKIESIVTKNTNTGKTKEELTEGLFVAIGHKPATQFLKGQIQLDEKGYIKTGLNYGPSDWLKSYPTMTSVPGVFAAGDNVDFRYKQAATAAGFGVMAALDAEWWLERE